MAPIDFRPTADHNWQTSDASRASGGYASRSAITFTKTADAVFTATVRWALLIHWQSLVLSTCLVPRARLSLPQIVKSVQKR